MVWFAWHPVRIEGRQWVWLRRVWAQLEVAATREHWVYYAEGPGLEEGPR
jgi:hypothetical protein